MTKIKIKHRLHFSTHFKTCQAMTNSAKLASTSTSQRQIYTQLVLQRRGLKILSTSRQLGIHGLLVELANYIYLIVGIIKPECLKWWVYERTKSSIC